LNKAIAGSGAHHELNSHLIDLALYLVGKITAVAGMEQTFIKERPAPANPAGLATKLTAEKSASGLEPVDVDDATLFLARFANNAVGSFESTRFAAGRRNHNRFEINGSKGSIVFNLEEMNRLEYYDAEAPKDVPGFRSIMVTEDCHPYITHWWPPGHLIGYQNSFVNQFADFFQAIIEDRKPEPGFEAGLENQKVLDAVSRSITANAWVGLDQ
jgi:predicted dehydrogenase